MTRARNPRAVPSDRIDRTGLRPDFWRRFPLESLPRHEWEALCDGCGKCCLIKLEDADSGAIAYTNISCRLLDNGTCRCGNYALRKQLVPDCVKLDPDTLEDALNWIPQTCAYRLIAEGRDLEPWHPLISGDPETVHAAGVSLRGAMVSEYEVEEDDWEDHVLGRPV